jgi:hypothetical protein
MEFASSNLVQLRIIEEEDYGVTPDDGNPNNIRMTGESLAFSLGKSESAEITPDRMTTDLVVTSASAAGGFNFELSYREFDTLLRAALMSNWVYYGEQDAGVGQGIGTDFVADFTANTITADVAPTGTSAFTTLQKGQWIQVRAPGSANNLKHVKVSPTVAPTATVITLDAGTPLVVENDVVGVALSSSRVVNGVTKKTFTIERCHLDVNQFFQFRGMAVSKINLSLSSGSILSGSIEFMGKNGDRTTVTALPGTPIESTAYDVMNAVSGVANIMEGGAPMTGAKIKKLDLSIDNSLRGQDAIGELGNAGIGLGTLKVTGNLEVYLADGTIYDKFLNNTRTSLQFVASDNAKNGYGFQVPAMKYGDAKVQAGSKDSDCMISVPFTGIKDTGPNGTQKKILIDRMGE